jgi:hypothetical protein
VHSSRVIIVRATCRPRASKVASRIVGGAMDT